MKRLIYIALRVFSAMQHVAHERLTRAGWLALACCGAAAAAGIDTNRTVSFQAFTFLAALLLIALIAAFAFRAKVSVSRELPRYATAGEPLEYRVTVRNLGRRALRAAAVLEGFGDPRPSYAQWVSTREPGEERRNWVDRHGGYFRWRWLIERRTPQPVVETALEELAPGEHRSVRLSLTPRRRGRIEMAALMLTRIDPLGLIRGLVRVPAEGRVTALPRRYRLPQLALPGARRFQQGGVSLASSIGDSEEFIGLRDYRPGDSLQRLHWKSMARAGKPIVKEYQDEFFERHALVLDTSTARGEDAVFEEAVSLAASFVYAIDTQECLLDLLFVGGEVQTYTAGRGQLHAEHMLEVLAAVAPSLPQAFAALSGTLRAQRARLTSCILLLVGWDEERRELLEALAGSGLEVRALLVCERAALPQELPHRVFALHPGEIEAGLARLS